MKNITLNGTEIGILREAIFRPTEGATLETFIAINRLVEPLHLREDLNPNAIFNISLEDQDWHFLLSEWKKANCVPMWSRVSTQNLDKFEIMKTIIDLNQKLMEVDNVKSNPAR